MKVFLFLLRPSSLNLWPQVHIFKGPAYSGLSAAIRPSVCTVAALFLYALDNLVVIYFRSYTSWGNTTRFQVKCTNI